MCSNLIAGDLTIDISLQFMMLKVSGCVCTIYGLYVCVTDPTVLSPSPPQYAYDQK